MDLKIAMSVDFLIYNVKSELAFYFSLAIFFTSVKLKGLKTCRLGIVTVGLLVV